MKKCHEMEQKKKVNNEKSSAVYEEIIFGQKANNKIHDDGGQPSFNDVKKQF